MKTKLQKYYKFRTEILILWARIQVSLLFYIICKSFTYNKKYQEKIKRCLNNTNTEIKIFSLPQLHVSDIILFAVLAVVAIIAVIAVTLIITIYYIGMLIWIYALNLVQKNQSSTSNEISADYFWSLHLFLWNSKNHFLF